MHAEIHQLHSLNRSDQASVVDHHSILTSNRSPGVLLGGVVASGVIECGIGAGVESMTAGGAPGAGGIPPINLDELMTNPLAVQCLVPSESAFVERLLILLNG